jgi:SRSO17 transposase
MIDARLYLPAVWCEDAGRCDEAGIPEEDRRFKMKREIALDIIRHQQFPGVQFDYIGGDGYCGNSMELAESIEEMGLVYMLDIHSSLTVYPEESAISVPAPESKRGRRPGRAKPEANGVRADKYMSELEPEDWQRLEVRNTAKGKLRGDYHFRTVYIWDETGNRMLRRLLVIRRTETKTGDYEYKYSFTNANPGQYTEKGIACMQAQRFFVERCIKENQADFGYGQVPDPQVAGMVSSNSA